MKRRGTPRVIQAIPLQDIDHEPPRPSIVWAHIIVAGFVIGIALLNGLVPRVAEILRAVLP